MFKEVEKLDNFNVINFVDFNNILTGVFINRKNQEITENKLYYLEVKRNKRIPRYFWGKWLLLKFCWCFPSDNGDGLFYLERGKKSNKYSSKFCFCVLSEKESEAEIKKNSFLNGFRNVISDSEYFSAIPKINELYHLDNGIISKTNVYVCYEISDNLKDWKNFSVSHTTKLCKNNKKLKMASKEHKNI